MRRMFVGLLALVTVAATPAVALAWSTQGAEMLSTSENAVDVGVGYPMLRGQFHLPLSTNLTIIPQFTFFYGMDTSVPVVGDGLLVGIRYRVYRSGDFNIALQAEPGLIMRYHPGGFGLGIQIGLPEVLLSYRITPKVLLVGGFKMPIAISVHPSPVFASIPILFNMGAEFGITNEMNAFVTLDVGPDILAFSGGSTAQFRGVFLAGIAYRF